MLPQNFFENLHTIGRPFYFFLNNFRQILFKVFAPKSECFTKYDALYSYIFDYACLGRRAYGYRKGSKLWKNCIHQKHA